MANIVLFDEFVEDLGLGKHGDLNAADLRVALYTSSATFTAADANPAYSATNECSGGTYVAKGELIASNGYTEASGTGTLAGTTASWTGLTLSAAADWALIYNDTATSPVDAAIGYVVLASVGTSGGDLTLTFGSNTVLTIVNQVL